MSLQWNIKNNKIERWSLNEGGMLYKCTLQFPTEKRALEFAERHRQISEQWSDTRMFVENKCIEFVAQDADKKTGVEVLCEQLDITLKDIAFCGHDKEDKELLERCYGIES